MLQDRLRGEPAARATVRQKNGTPRLFVNDQEVYPLLAWSWSLVHSVEYFKSAGIQILHPILGLNALWPRKDRILPDRFDQLFYELLDQHPDAFFLPRILLDVPLWWKQDYPQELVRCERPVPENAYRPFRENPEGHWLWGLQVHEPSLASDQYIRDMDHLLKSFLRHIESSPLKSRLVGYQIGSGIYGEWHYFISEYLPDSSDAVKQKIGPLPSMKERTTTTAGLLRDPKAEAHVISFYHRFHHDVIASTIEHFCRITKQETQRRVLCGVFYGYQLENSWIQEGGHLAPERLLNCDDIDFWASPYSYQTTNLADRYWWEHDVTDDAENFLGRSRGIAGDAGYRVLLDSVHRNNKLFFVEIDPATFLEPEPVHPDGSGASDLDQELCMIGGEQSTTEEGSRDILRRDLGQMLVKGNAGWLFDFGPVLRTGQSWYADSRVIDWVRPFVKLGSSRSGWDMSSCSEIAAIYDAKSLYATRHWFADPDFAQGGVNLDYFSRWFMDSQARALHRMGAPLDFLYHFDLEPGDRDRYRLLLMVNLFYLTDEEVDRLEKILCGSGITAVWAYAPGFLSPQGFDLDRMQRLSGFTFHRMDSPGPMMIDASIENEQGQFVKSFGTLEYRHPRFQVTDPESIPLGTWHDRSDATAFAIKSMDGWQSVYVGSLPLPPDLLRWLVRTAGAMLWSSESDLVMARKDTAMICATRDGRRTFSLPQPLVAEGGGAPRDHFDLKMRMGEVQLFHK